MPISDQRRARARWRPRWAPVAAATGIPALLVMFVSIGGPDAPGVAALTALYLVIAGGAPAAFYLLGGIGLGRVFAPITRGARDAAALHAGLGLALLLSVSHALGCLGLLAGASGRALGIGVCGLGLVLWAASTARRATVARTPTPALVAIPGVALLLAAAVQPPGWLWASEFGGFDALSYHLQLPQEWLANGRIAPLAHNVYSYLPGYVEAAFLHLAVILGSPLPRPGAPAFGLMAGDGVGAVSCQILHAGLAVIAAWLLARCTRAAIELARGAAPEGVPQVVEAGRIGVLAAAVFLCTPWVVVVGSLAYNDLGAVALGAAAAAAALDLGLTPGRRGAIAGAIVGVACGCKPTALLFVGAPVGVLLLGTTGARHWARIVAAGCAPALVALAPWLIRNSLYSGNPVFPYLTVVFGTAHWNAEQAERFAHSTFFRGTLPERLALMVFEDPGDPAGARHRGLLHPQWFGFFWIAATAACLAIADRATRRVAALLVGATFVQALAWLYASHLQSRFLLPMAIPTTALIGLGAWSLTRRAAAGVRWGGRVAVGGLTAAAVVQAAASGVRFALEQAGRPNALLVAGTGIRTGALFRDWTQAQAAGASSPEAYVNLALPPGRTVYLLGDATPLYAAPPVVYATTWDRSPLGDAIRAHPDEPARWAEDLRRADVDYVLVNLAELHRYRKSGYIDPALTASAVDGFLAACGPPLRQWAGGRALFALVPPPGPGGSP